MAIKTKEARSIQIWSVSPGNTLSKLLWRSGNQYKNCVFLGMCWCGSNLLCSKIDVSASLLDLERERELYPSEEDEYSKSPSSTIVIDFKKGKINKLLSIGYFVLSADSTGMRLAAASPWNSDTGTIDFYSIASKYYRATKISSLKQNSWLFTNGYMDNILVGWDLSSKGIFVVAPRQQQQQDLGRRVLYYIDMKGNIKSILPYTCSVLNDDYLSTAIFLTPKRDVWFWMDYNRQGGEYIEDAYVTANEGGLSTKLPGTHVRSLMPKSVESYSVLSSSPDQRFLVIQDRSFDARDFTKAVPEDVWQLDIKLKRRRKIATILPVDRVFSSEHNRLLVRMPTQEDQIAEYGFLSISTVAPQNNNEPEWELVPRTDEQKANNISR